MALAMSMSNFVWYVKTSGTWIRSRRARASMADVTGQWQWIRSKFFSASVSSVWLENGSPA